MNAAAANINDLDGDAFLAELIAAQDGYPDDPEKRARIDAEIAAEDAAREAAELQKMADRANLIIRKAPVRCGRCGGKGFLFEYTHIDNGKCWGCLGAGVVDA